MLTKDFSYFVAHQNARIAISMGTLLTVLAGALYTNDLPSTSVLRSLCSFEAVSPATVAFCFPEVICEFTDPVYYPPLFGNIFDFTTLSEFWGKTWHQIFRWSFIALGAFPLGGLAPALGLSLRSQKTVGFVGAFLASSFMHAYSFFLMADPITPTGDVGLLEIMGVFSCFMVQGLGSLIEPVVIPLVPKRLAGGKLWTISFLLITLPLFTIPVGKPARLFSIHKPLDQWNILNLLLPAVITPIIVK
ncbi:hypothetical protein MJO28_010119 [Puccinia striiformis f. sp. tritici]|uniref:Uncharacterized protein n=1 Tax=Puccinia striiformis f. sp. tritici TaxID=168172 RepID=A0ACC0E570_9BASI|nr:hypothetical protein MJO28_010119 [Puccinia striiformis f. sp. tritici]